MSFPTEHWDELVELEFHDIAKAATYPDWRADPNGVDPDELRVLTPSNDSEKHNGVLEKQAIPPAINVATTV